MTNEDINKFIDEIHFRSSTHLMHKLQNKFPNVEKKHLQRIIDSRLKDHFGKTFRVEPYYVKIFSHSPNCWFHDLMDNGKDQEPRYWHIFIGTNTHYAVALPLNDKKASSVKKTLAEFINEYKPYKLTSDEESAFIEKGNVKIVELLLTNEKLNINMVFHAIKLLNMSLKRKGINEMTLLSFAINHGRDEIIQLLLSNKYSKLSETIDINKRSKIAIIDNETPIETFEKTPLYMFIEKQNIKFRKEKNFQKNTIIFLIFSFTIDILL